MFFVSIKVFVFLLVNVHVHTQILEMAISEPVRD